MGEFFRKVLGVISIRSRTFGIKWSKQNISIKKAYCVFSHDVMAAIFVSQNNETAAMFVSQTGPVGVELFSYVNDFFCSNKFAKMLAT